MAITDPRDISGLLAWYSAEAETGYVDGDEVTGWTDLSGNGNHATAASGSSGIEPKWKATDGSGGGPAIEYTAAGTNGGGATTGDGYFTLPDMFTGLTAGEIAITVKQNSATSRNGLWSINALDTGFEASHYPFDGPVYNTFGLNGSAQRQSFTPSVAITDWRRFNVYSAAGDWQAFLDGISQKTYTGGTVAWNSAPLLGASSHSSAPIDMKFHGWMGAVVIYNRKLTTTERSDLDTWLAANPSGGTAGGGGGTGSDVVLAQTLPALVDTLVLETYTPTETDNQAGGILIRGASLEPVNAPDVEPMPATVSRAEMRDKAVAYTQPTMVNGRPT